jgi:type 1 glutamine amidotransferase
MKTNLGTALAAALAWSWPAAPAALAADPPKVVLVAGRPSHGPGDHEFNAGVLLMAKCLRESGAVNPVVVKGGWPEDESVFDGASSLVFFMDGGGGHPMIQKDRLDRVLKPLMDKGVGLVCMHYAVEVPKGKPGDAFLDWIGGYYETGFSTNPHWTAEVKSLPTHPITRGVKPFALRDEWYYNIRFRPDMKGVVPIVVASPDEEARQGKTSSPRGPYSHIVAANGREEVLGWAVERAGGGRGFGFTGAHFHKNFGDPNFRKLVLNSIAWSAKVEVPTDGLNCSVSEDDLKQNLDDKTPRKR